MALSNGGSVIRDQHSHFCQLLSRRFLTVNGLNFGRDHRGAPIVTFCGYDLLLLKWPNGRTFSHRIWRFDHICGVFVEWDHWLSRKQLTEVWVYLWVKDWSGQTKGIGWLTEFPAYSHSYHIYMQSILNHLPLHCDGHPSFWIYPYPLWAEDAK